MAKRIYSATAGAGLTNQSAKTYDQYVEVDFDGWSETKNMTLQTLLRSEVFPAPAIDGSGSATYTLSYATYDRISFVMDQDCVVTLSDIPAGSTNYLKVTKGAANIITFVGVTGTIDSIQTGLTSLLFRIEKRSVTYVQQLNNQFSDSLVIGDLTPVFAAINTLNYWESTINNNICEFEASFSITSSGSASVIDIAIANWNVSKKQSGYISCDSVCLAGATDVTKSARIKEDQLYIKLDTSTSAQVDVLISGTFKVV